MAKDGSGVGDDVDVSEFNVDGGFDAAEEEHDEEDAQEEEDGEDIEGAGEDEYVEDEGECIFRFKDGINPLDFVEKNDAGVLRYQQFERLEYEALAGKKRRAVADCHR